MAYCSKCGTLLSEDVKFCPKCGQPINAVNQQQVNNPELQSVVRQKDKYDEVKKKPSGILFKWIMAIAVLVLLCFLLYKVVGGSGSKSSPFTTQIVTFKETAPTDNFDIEVEINVDYPISGSKELLNSISSFIVETLTDVYTFEEVSVNPHYDGDLSDGQKIVDFYGKAKIDELKPNGMGEARIFINKVHETDVIVSYLVHMSGDTGGSGISTKYGVTFDKHTGKQISVIKDSKNKKFSERLIEDVINSIDSEDIDMLEESELKAHPYPKYAPFISKDGISFIYQKYEIGSGALGEIEITLPIHEMIDCLSDDARSLMEETAHK